MCVCIYVLCAYVCTCMCMAAMMMDDLWTLNMSPEPFAHAQIKLYTIDYNTGILYHMVLINNNKIIIIIIKN